MYREASVIFFPREKHDVGDSKRLQCIRHMQIPFRHHILHIANHDPDLPRCIYKKQTNLEPLILLS